MHLHCDTETLEYVREGHVRSHVFTIPSNLEGEEVKAAVVDTGYEFTSPKIIKVPAGFS
jgi:hypothetical protein